MRTARSCISLWLFLAACAAKPSPKPAEEIPRLAELRAEAGKRKGELFRAQLEHGPGATVAKLAEDLHKWTQARVSEEAGILFKAKEQGIHYARRNAPKPVLDMIVHAQDLKPEEREEVIRLYTQAQEDREKMEIKIPEAESQAEIKALLLAFDSSLSSAMEKIAGIIHRSPLDRDYAYRAFLREHRRR